MEPLIHALKYLSLLCIVTGIIFTLIPHTYDYSLLAKCQHPVLADKIQLLLWAKCVSTLKLKKPAVVFLGVLCCAFSVPCFCKVCHPCFPLVMRFSVFLTSVCFFVLFWKSAADRNRWTDELPSSSYVCRHFYTCNCCNYILLKKTLLLMEFNYCFRLH